jgi:hypothetical protein
VRGEGAAAALWVDPAVHADERRRFDSYVVKGPGPDDCDFFTGAIGTDGYGRFYIYRGGSGICVRPHRYALARTLAAPLGADEFGLHERDMPLCVKFCGMDRPRQHASVRSARSQAAARNAAPIRGEGPSSWLSQYQPTRCTFAQLKAGFGEPRARFGLCTGYRRRELPGGVHQMVYWCTPTRTSADPAEGHLSSPL